MTLPGNLMTTAMAVMPHTDVDQALDRKGVPMDQILAQSLISPATCCLVNKDREKTVEKAFDLTRIMSQTLRDEYHLI